jgi:hypothetical protein
MAEPFALDDLDIGQPPLAVRESVEYKLAA